MWAAIVSISTRDDTLIFTACYVISIGLVSCYCLNVCVYVRRCYNYTAFVLIIFGTRRYLIRVSRHLTRCDALRLETVTNVSSADMACILTTVIY